MSSCADDDDDLGLLLELQQHLQLGVRLKARQHAGGVVVVEQLAAKLEVELVVELCDALPDVLRTASEDISSLSKPIFMECSSSCFYNFNSGTPVVRQAGESHKHFIV